MIENSDYEVEPHVVFDHGAYRATVTVRSKQAFSLVREVGYAFAEGFDTEAAAMQAAKQYAVIASLDPSRLVRTADSEFALQ